MQQVAKLPESLMNSKDPLRELPKQLGLDELQLIGIHTYVFSGTCCGSSKITNLADPNCKCELCTKENN
jgi:hypothetical protein